MLSEGIKKELVSGLTEIFQNNMSMIIFYVSVSRGEATYRSE